MGSLPLGPETADRVGWGPLIRPSSESNRSLQQQVFERVRAAGQMPRVAVAKELGVSPASITAVTSRLIEAGYIEEVASPRAGSDHGPGRPPVALGVRAEAHHVVGIRLSEREHTAALVDFAGNLIAGEAVPCEPGPATTETLLSEAARVLDRVCDRAGLPRSAVSALGLGLPGLVDFREGVVLWSPILNEAQVDLARMAADHLGAPVSIDNDANLVSLAELWFGAGRAMRDFAVVTIEQGVGMGLVLDHQIYRGSGGLGMELGHTKVHLDGALCRCGQRGCLEAYVADYALVREAATALNWTNADGRSSQVLLESLFDHAKAGNAAARSIFRRAGRYLSIGLANVINLLDPSLIILSGERMRYDYLYAAEVLSEMESHALSRHRPPPKIEVHAWGDLLWARGAAALALSSLTASHLSASREVAAQ